jgi:hypothetical protein
MAINKPFWYIENENNENIQNDKDNEKEIKSLSNSKSEPLINLNDIKKFIFDLNNGLGNKYLLKEGNVINGTNFDKYLNILDPLNNHNNLGKSINYHSNSKMKRVIAYINKKLKKIQEIRKKSNPYLYINSLLNLFKITLSEKYIELFTNTLNTPEIIANSKIYKKFHKNEIKKNKAINIDKSEIQKFNNIYLENKNNKINIEDEDFDEYIEEDEDLEEKDFENTEVEEEEDNDKYQEEEEEEKKMKNEIIDEDFDENEQILEIKENINFQQITNNEIIQDLFEQNKKRDDVIKYNNRLLKESKDYSKYLEKTLKDQKLI